MISTHPWKKAAVIAGSGIAMKITEGLAPFQELHYTVSSFQAECSAQMLGATSIPVYVDQTALHSLGYSVRVIPTCNALVELTVVVTAILVLSLSLRKRLVLALAAIAVIGVVNCARIATVLAIGTRNPEGADFVHNRLYPWVWLVLFAMLWYQWLIVERSDRTAVPPEEPIQPSI